MTMRVPFIDLGALHAPLRQPLLDAMAQVLDAQQYIGGPAIAQLERALADRVGVAHAIGVSSGTDALLVALMAHGIGPGDEVITTPLTFFATAGAIARLGATPVFADIDLATYNLDPQAVEAAITPRTRAILPVHLYGQLADMSALGAIARAHDLAIIEDAAQAIGASALGVRAGATLGCFSFFPTKNLGALGDGGMVTTDDSALARRIRALARHGAEPKYHHALIGGNFRLDTLQAACLLVKLPHLDAWQAARAAHAAAYLEQLAGLDAITLPHVPQGHAPCWHQLVIRSASRDALRDKLAARGVETQVYYPVAMHQQACFAHLGYRPGQLPQAERAAREVLAIPCSPSLTLAQRDHVIDALRACA